MNKCKFDMAWIGKCFKDTNSKFCSKHEGIKCCICGKQATHECPETMSLVCGFPLCDDPKCKAEHNYKAHGGDKPEHLKKGKALGGTIVVEVPKETILDLDEALQLARDAIDTKVESQIKKVNTAIENACNEGEFSTEALPFTLEAEVLEELETKGYKVSYYDTMGTVIEWRGSIK